MLIKNQALYYRGALGCHRLPTKPAGREIKINTVTRELSNDCMWIAMVSPQQVKPTRAASTSNISSIFTPPFASLFILIQEKWQNVISWIGFLIKNTVLADKNNLMFINLGSLTRVSPCPSAPFPSSQAITHWLQGICSKRRRLLKAVTGNITTGSSKDYKLLEGTETPQTFHPEPTEANPWGEGHLELDFIFFPEGQSSPA